MRIAIFDRRFILPAALAGGVAMGIAVLFSPTAYGQTGVEQSGQPPQAEVSKQEVDQFAEAADKVAELGRDLNAKMGKAQSEAELEALRQDARGQMAQAIEKTGLSVDRYNEIYLLSRKDPQLNNKIMENMEQN